MSFFSRRDFNPALSALLPIDTQKPRSVERHDLIRRDENERNAGRLGHERPYEAHHEKHPQRGDHGREH
jgi:hypothetical protein